MHTVSHFLADRRQLARQASALHSVLHHEAAVPGHPAIVGEPQEGEGFGPLVATGFPGPGGKAPELDQPCLLLVKLQTEPG